MPTPLAETSLPSESDLEAMIVAEPQMVSDAWMLIGRQEATAFGGRVDLLAIAPDATLILIELKRDKTPRDVVAQAIDYASWVEDLDTIAIGRIYNRFRPGADLATDFMKRYGEPLDEEALNSSHQIVVVASSLDDSTERIIRYLNARNIAINVLAFQVFADPAGLLWSRAWLLDPVHSQPGVISGSIGPSEPWNGEFYVSFGHGASRSWDEAVRYGFVSGGGGAWYSKTLQLLQPGDHVWVRIPGVGYVGVGTVASEAVRASEFLIDPGVGPTPAMDVLREGNYHAEWVDDPERSEYFVRIDWEETRSISQAVHELGLFGNQNTVCKPVTPKWRHTVDRLRTLRFGENRDRFGAVAANVDPDDLAGLTRSV